MFRVAQVSTQLVKDVEQLVSERGKTMNATHQLRRNVCRRTLITLLIITVLGCSQEILAQQWTNTGTNDIANTNSGNVGVGTNTPDTNAKLHVFKPLGAGVDIQSPNTGGWSRVRLVTGTRTYGWFAGDAGNSDAPNKIGLYDYTALAFRMMVDSAGNVGFGTSNPAGPVDVQTNSATANKLVGRFGNNSSSGGAVLRVYANTASNSTLYPAFELSDDSYWIATVAADRTRGLRFRTGTNISSGESSLTDRMVVSPAGNIGIGTTSPSNRLSIVGPVQNGVFTVFIDSTAGGQAGSQHGIQINGTSATTYLSAGATSVFGAAPHVNVNAADNANYAVTFGNTGGWGRVLRLRSSSSDSTVPVMQVEGSNGGTVALSAQANGTVGVGTGSPDASYKLDVVGNVRVSGNIAAKYQDVAEWVETSQALPAATVVVLHANRSNHVVASSRAYDTRVAGVISSQPGLILGERAENKVLVATTGRVKIKVDATRGAIRVGDLLVTSNKEGVAMKSRPISVGGARIHRPGTIIGKALEPLANGRGEILVLLSLQ